MACPAGDAAGWQCSQGSAPSSRVGPDVHQALGDCALGLALSIARGASGGSGSEPRRKEDAAKLLLSRASARPRG